MTSSTRYQVTLFFLSLLAGGLSGQAAEIQFKHEADVRGSLVLLGDIADIQDPDPQQIDALRRIELFPAPARGRIRAVRDIEIRQLLQLHGIKTVEHRFAGAELVRIAHAQDRTPVKTGFPMAAPSVVESVTKTEKKIVVAKQPIAVGSVIRSLDVELKSPDRPVANGSAAESTEAVIGQESSRAYTAGQVIDPRSLRKPILVRRGDAVSVIAKAAGVRVRTTAKALADGSLGDLLPIEAENRDKYSALVTGPKQAEVFASGASATDEGKKAMTIPRHGLR